MQVMVMVMVMVMVIESRPVTYTKFAINRDFLEIFHGSKLAQKTRYFTIHSGFFDS